MREILFRGFTPYENSKEKVYVKNKWITGKWVVGSYMTLDKTTYCVKEDYEKCPDNTEHYIVFDQMTDWGLPNRHLRADVIPETVGQYIGLTDKNGTKIFEGDIVRITDEHESIYDCNCGVGDIQFKYGHWYVLGKPQNSLWDLCDCYYCEVIGNIHDNPELLKNG